MTRAFVYLTDAAFAVNIARVTAVELKAEDRATVILDSVDPFELKLDTRRDVQTLVYALGFHTDDGSRRAMEARIARKEAQQ